MNELLLSGAVAVGCLGLFGLLFASILYRCSIRNVRNDTGYVVSMYGRP